MLYTLVKTSMPCGKRHSFKVFNFHHSQEFKEEYFVDKMLQPSSRYRCKERIWWIEISISEFNNLVLIRHKKYKMEMYESGLCVHTTNT